MSFADTNHGIVVGLSGRVASTSDGGSTWHRQTITDSLLEDFIDVRMLDTSTALALGSGGEIFSTSDGGVTWHFKTGLHDVFLKQMVFSDKLHGMIMGWYGRHYKTTDGGDSWNQFTFGNNETPFGLSYPD